MMVIVSAASALATAEEVELSGETRIVFADRAAAADFLRQSDRSTREMGHLERQMRLKSSAPVTEEEFLKHASQQTLDWSDHEIKGLRQAIELCRAKIAPWKLPLPASIPLIKTTGMEEGGAAYCRREAIILPERMARGAGPGREPLLLHELFHILSRHNPALRRELYAVVGFEPCGNGKLPEKLDALKVTNPDAPTYDFAISLEVDSRIARYVPLIQIKNSDPTAGFMISQLDFKLLAVETDGDSWRPALVDGESRLIPTSHPAYQQRIGRNTQYTIHPEEVLADNFSLLMRGKTDVPSPEILADVERVLKQRAGKPVEIGKLILEDQ
jgi:hypothetical protein